MDGKLLSLKQAAKFLFGDESDASCKRARRFIEGNDLQTVKTGKKLYISRAVLEQFIGVSGVSSQRQGLRGDTGPAGEQEAYS